MRRRRAPHAGPPGCGQTIGIHICLLLMRVDAVRKGDKAAPLQRKTLPTPLMDVRALEMDVGAMTSVSTLPDAEIVRRVRAGDRALFEILMRRHNQRLYRAARAVVKDENEVEDIMQQAYINAFLHL